MAQRLKIRICPLCGKPILKTETGKAVIPVSLGLHRPCHWQCVKKEVAMRKGDSK